MKHWFAIAVLTALSGCASNTTVDEIRATNTQLEVKAGDRIVLLGRHEAGHYETDLEFVSCVGRRLKGVDNLAVVPELQFLDQMFPWFEPRTAPKSLKRLERLLQEPLITQKLQKQQIRYMVWLDGHTETVNGAGSMSCGIGPGGAGCFGYTSWDKVSFYEAMVWDLPNMKEVGRVRVDSEGTSYVIGVGAPIPFIAQVKEEACQGMGKQLQSFFETKQAE